MLHNCGVIGIKRPPALMCSTTNPDNLECYEISMIEPLHDLKNVINRVFSELPHAVSEQELSKTIKTAIELLRGKLLNTCDHVYNQ